MGTIARDPDQNLPPGYLDFKGSGVPIKYFGFHGYDRAVHRFAARYRFAKEFQSAKFESYSSGTARAYSALCKFLFTYGAFETLRRVLGTSREDLGVFDLSQYPRRDWDATLREPATHARVFELLRDSMENKTLRDECQKFLSRKRYHILRIACALRNGFAHGHLTPSGNRAEPEDTRLICRALTGALFIIMDREFSSRVAETIDEIYGDHEADERA
jgi:hypothetical protein